MQHFHSPGVPHAVAMIPESSIFESPKSLIMILLSSSGLWYKRFSGLRSRCTTPELWRIKETTIKNYHFTLQKKEVYAWWKVPAKCFKICHTFICIWKPKVAFSISCYFMFLGPLQKFGKKWRLTLSRKFTDESSVK